MTDLEELKESINKELARNDRHTPGPLYDFGYTDGLRDVLYWVENKIESIKNRTKVGIREQVAEIQHDKIWAHWTKYQFSKCVQNEDGSLTIPADLVDRWRRQAETPYSELTEEEKESDRHQADKVLQAVTYFMLEAIPAYLADKKENELDSQPSELDNEERSVQIVAIWR